MLSSVCENLNGDLCPETLHPAGRERPCPSEVVELQNRGAAQSLTPRRLAPRCPSCPSPRAVLCPAEQLAWKGVGPGPPPSSACPSAVTAEGPPSSETSLRCLDPSCPHSWGFPAGCSEAPHQAHACPKDVETGGSQPASQLTVLVPQAGYPSSCGVACPLPHRWRGARVVWGSAGSGVASPEASAGSASLLGC